MDAQPAGADIGEVAALDLVGVDLFGAVLDDDADSFGVPAFGCILGDGPEADRDLSVGALVVAVADDVADRFVDCERDVRGARGGGRRKGYPAAAASRCLSFCCASKM